MTSFTPVRAQNFKERESSYIRNEKGVENCSAFNNVRNMVSIDVRVPLLVISHFIWVL